MNHVSIIRFHLCEWKKILHEAHLKHLCMSDDVSIIKVMQRILVAGNLIFSRASSILHTKKKIGEKEWEKNIEFIYGNKRARY
jgi:hypothetical protein